MFQVLDSFVDRHDLGGLAMALVIGFAASFIALRLFAQARPAGGMVRAAWLLLAAAVAGTGAWAGHFLSILAFDPGVRAGYAPEVSFYALTLATGTAMLAFWVAVTGPPRSGSHALAAGCILGLGAVAARYLGVGALIIEGHVTWSAALVGLSAAIAVIGFVAALLTAGEGDNLRRQLAAGGVMALTLSLLHVVGMGAMTVTPDATALLPQAVLGAEVMRLMVTAYSVVTILAGLGVALIVQHLAATAHSRMRRLADAAKEGLVVVRTGRIIDANAAFCALVNGRLADLIGVPLDGVLLTYDDEARTAPDGGREALLQPDDGRAEIPVTVFSRALDAADPADGDLADDTTVFAIRDQRERRAAEAKIRYLAEHDGLTGLANRNALQHRLRGALERARAGGDRLALLHIDLDRFKDINDLHGQEAGDALLVEVAARLKAAVIAPSFVARLGSDEFMIVQKAADQPGDAAFLAADLVESLAVPLVWKGQEIGMGATIGLSLYPDDGDAVEALMANADLALYRAKEQGRGGFRFFKGEMDAAIRERRALARDLRRGLEADELVVFYQPLARAADGEVCSFESLVRWRHPERGMVPPGDFIAVAEESGLIAAIGEHVLRTACAEAASWPRLLRVAVNLSPLQLHDPGLPTLVHEVLLSSGLSPARLELEVTESALFEDYQRALDNLRRLKALGVRIAMDDFGTGFSSLSTLQSFPFDKLKIDKSFIEQMHHDDRAKVIVRAILGLGRSLGIPVVAEGVETGDQIAFLRAENCDELQGYALGRPSPADSLGPWLTGPALSVVAPTPSKPARRNRRAA